MENNYTCLRPNSIWSSWIKKRSLQKSQSCFWSQMTPWSQRRCPHQRPWPEQRMSVALPDGMSPCLVPGCPGVNLYTPLNRFRHWYYQHVAQHHQFRCAAPGCRKVTRKPKDIRCHMRKTRGLTAAKALILTFADEKAVPNPSYKDPGTCPAPPGYAQWLSECYPSLTADQHQKGHTVPKQV